MGKAGKGRPRHLRTRPEPRLRRGGQNDLKTKSQMCTRSALSVWTAESFVLAPEPIGTDSHQPRSFFSLLAVAYARAETSRADFSMASLGSRIPHAEGGWERFPGEPSQGSHKATAALLPRTGLRHTVCLEGQPHSVTGPCVQPGGGPRP